MIVDATVIPGLLILAAELVALAAVGYVVVRVALRQDDERMALAQGLVVGPALWGLITNFVLYAAPGLAGAAVGWGVTLALGAVLAWRAPDRICPRPRVAAGFAVAVLALFWAALASRQLLGIPDLPIHLGLAATIRAGGFPPELPWNPGMPLHYHHGPPLMVGLLAPPFGPDLAFVSELLGVYAWMSFVLVVVTALLQRGSWMVALILAPLLVTIGAWTTGEWTWRSEAEGLLRIPVAAGVPSAGLGASLAEVYWPSVGLPARFPEPMLPDIWKPEFTLGYALTLVVLERVARRRDQSWPATLTLAALVGFLGLLVTTLVPVALALWLGLKALHLARQRASFIRGALRSGAGPAVAGLLLLGGGGAFTGILASTAPSGLELAWNFDPARWTALGTFDEQPGGLAVLGAGPLAVAAAAVALRRRDRLVVALAVGTGLFVLAGLALHYRPAPWDIIRFEGHARNFALAALLLALATRLSVLRSARMRLAAGALLLGLVTWPTVVEPVRYLGLAVGNGIQLGNAPSMPRAAPEPDASPIVRRTRMPAMSDRLASYIRNHTTVDARVFAVEPAYSSVFLATGRPNAAGFADVTHQIYHRGPEYLDALHYLEPAAIRRLGIEYVHATDAWMAELPARARGWLADPLLFELLIRDGLEALYRVRPAFLSFDAAPTPQSFEALRSVPPSTMVYLAPQTVWLDRLRIASVLSHAHLVGDGTGLLFSRTAEPWTVDSIGNQVPDLVVLPASIDPWMFAPAGRLPVWHNGKIAVYAPNGAVAPIMLPPPRPDPPAFDLQVSDVRAADGHITFAATFDNRSPDQWTGQDWVVIAVDGSPWNIPLAFGPDGRTPVAATWFDGWLGPSVTTTTHTYEFDALASRLAVRNSHGVFTAAAASGGVQGAGVWTLAVRLRHEWSPNSWRGCRLPSGAANHSLRHWRGCVHRFQ